MATNIPMDEIKPGASQDGVYLDIEEPSQQPRYRKNKASRASSYGLGASQSTLGSRSRHSYHGEDEASLNKELLSKLPSRQLATQVHHVLGRDDYKNRNRRPGYSTLRLKGDALVVEQMAQELMAQPDFQDEPDALQNENIREKYPGTTLSTKMEIKHNIERKMKGKEKKPSAMKTASYSISVSWVKFKRRFAEVGYSLELWKSHFKAIEGHFGTGVTSYFRFIKWLFLVNIPVFILTLAFVIVPQLLYRYLDDNGGYPDDQVDFTGWDIITGSGWFNETELYYGSYTNETIQLVGDENIEYHMQSAYLLTVFAYFIVVLVVTMKSLSQSYRRNYIDSSEEFNFYYVTKVFTGWDHSVYDPNAAKLKHKSLFKELQEYLSKKKKVPTATLR